MEGEIAPDQASKLVHEICSALNKRYIFPEQAEYICRNLERHLEEGSYEGITEGEFLAFALTTHLQEVNHDEHLWVRWHQEVIPELGEPLHKSTDWLAGQEKTASQGNNGFHKVEVLPGNVGYLDLRKFFRLEWARDTALAALAIMAECQALIIDLRQCEGGSANMVVFFTSHLFPAKPVQLHSIYWRDEDAVQELWTSQDIPGPRLEDVPLFILVGKDTFSAAEGFAQDIKFHHRGILIGERTAGGAHPGASFRLGAHFELFLPIGRAFNPVNQEDWEGTGISPHILAAPENALEVAYQLAINEIGIG